MPITPVSNSLPVRQAAAAPKPQAAAPAQAAPAMAPDTAKMTTLQRHVAFFDGNGDGKITVGESREGLMKLGMSKATATLGALFINLGLASKTEGQKSTVVDVKQIAKAKHDSDSGIIDAGGNFVPAAFDKMFQQFDANRSGTLDATELDTMRKAHAQTKVGQVASKAEFGLLLQLAADGKETVNGKEVGSISRARMQAFYDGTLFPQLAAERAAAKQ